MHAPAPGTDTLAARWFDGQRAQARAVRVAREGDTLLLHADSADSAEGEAGARLPLRDVQWPERTRHGQRVAHLRGGGSLVFDDAAAFDAWRARHGHRDGWVVRAQMHWRSTLAAVLALLLLVAAGYRWGVPWAASQVVAVLPAGADAAVGDQALQQLRQGVLKPTRTAPAVQQAWRERLAQAVEATYPPGERVPFQLHVAGGGVLGANALALPGGHIVITDELLTLLQGADDAVLGVLAHEYGHVRRRHGLHALVRFGLVSAATSVALGDFSAVLAGVPALLAHLGYSRDAEREADADAAAVLRASGRDPAAMVVLFERLAQREGRREGQREARSGPPIAFASHPADEERVRFFREAGRAPR